MAQTNEFDGMTALVTGSSNGIGAATAVALAKRGAYVMVHYHHDRASAEKVLAEAGRGELIGGDLSTADGVHEFLRKISQPVDLLVNNAGSLIARTRFLDFTEELWNKVLMLNLTSAFLITKALLPAMVERKRGVVVNVSSVAARHGGGVGAIAYATAKGGLSVMTKGLAKEFAPQGIRVNAVSPGTVETNFHRTFSTEQMLAGARAATPAGRLGAAEEIAEVIVFLSSDAARFIHGQVIEVNGGFLMV